MHPAALSFSLSPPLSLKVSTVNRVASNRPQERKQKTAVHVRGRRQKQNEWAQQGKQKHTHRYREREKESEVGAHTRNKSFNEACTRRQVVIVRRHSPARVLDCKLLFSQPCSLSCTLHSLSLYLSLCVVRWPPHMTVARAFGFIHRKKPGPPLRTLNAFERIARRPTEFWVSRFEFPDFNFNSQLASTWIPFSTIDRSQRDETRPFLILMIFFNSCAGRKNYKKINIIQTLCVCVQ